MKDYAQIYRVKSLANASVKDVDTVKGYVTGYFSSFDVLDSDGDLMQRGAFSKTIAENGPNSKRDRIQYLFNHNPNQPIGKLKMLSEDDFGLYFEAQLSEATLGKDMAKMYAEGIIREHSIGFQIVKGESSREGYKIQEVKLWEGSAVTWGANEMTPVMGVKGLVNGQTPDALDMIERVSNILRKGTLSDESCIALELELKQALALIAADAAKSTLDNKEPQKPISLVELYKSL